MKRKLKFTKMVAAGNDFVVVDCRKGKLPGIRLSEFAAYICQRRTAIGADGLLILEGSKKADIRMRIFNADGSEAEMCGNGLRCAAIYAASARKTMRIETVSGIYTAEISGKNRVKIKMEEPKGLKLDIPLKINARTIKVNYIDTGVPHAVIFVEGLDGLDVCSIGRDLRYHERFKPRGANVDFVEVIDDKNIKMRTYERGLEDETLACGTGAVASAIITCHVSRVMCHGINVHTRGGVLRVHFKKTGDRIKNIYLEGEAKKVYEGEVDYV